MDISIGRFKLVPKQQADGACWYFTTKEGQPQLGYFKFPQLEPHQVRIKIMYTSICHTDSTQIRKGWVPLPRTSGHQYVGTIEAIGQSVTTRKIGQIVAVGYKKGSCGTCSPCNKGLKQGCRGHPNNVTNGPDVGGFSTHAYAQEDWTFVIPQGYDPQYAPPLMCAGITAYNPFARHCKKGDKIGVVGIGGLGHLSLKFGKALGYDVTAISTSADKQKDSLEFGATSFLVSTDENLKKHEQTFDVVMIVGNIPSQKFSNYLNLTKLGGKICNASILDPNPKIAFHQIVVSQRQICGVLIGDQQMVNDMLALVAKEKIQPVIQLADFEDFKNAFKKTEQYKARYRMVLKVPQNFVK